MLRITFCAYDKPDNVGGPVTWMQRLLPMLRRHGIETRVLFLLHWGDTGPALSSLLADGLECVAVPAHASSEERVRWILQDLRDHPADVFVPNLVVAGYFAARWAREAGIPTVGILHSDDPFYHAIRDEFVLGGAPFRLSSVVCVSRSLEDLLIASSPPDTSVERIPYGVPIPSVKVAPTEGRLRLAYVGRFAEEQKRISELTRALCRVVSEVPGTEAVLYGDGPDRHAVDAILASDNAHGRVRNGGRLSSEEIQRRLLESDVIVLLSDYEGLPIALLEAMAAGCVPVCLEMRSGIPELVTDGVTGLVVKDRGDDFVSAIRRLRDDPSLCERLSRSARSFASEEFGQERCAERWAELLKRLHRDSGDIRPVRMPDKLGLPPVNPALRNADPRPVPIPRTVRAYRRGRMWLGRVRRRLMGQPLS